MYRRLFQYECIYHGVIIIIIIIISNIVFVVVLEHNAEDISGVHKSHRNNVIPVRPEWVMDNMRDGDDTGVINNDVNGLLIIRRY